MKPDGSKRAKAGPGRSKNRWSIAALVFMNLLPYLCRLPQGWDWMAQYWPDPGMEILGLVFFHAFYSIAAVPLVLAIRSYRGSLVPSLVTLVVVTVATCFFNYDYDLASDAQAAIGLIVMPVVVGFLGFVGLALALLCAKASGFVRNRSS